jgi:hypothetical protein
VFSKIPKLVELQKEDDHSRISLLFDSSFPFKVRQIYHICGVPQGTTQNLTGNKLAHRFATAIIGEITISINKRDNFHLNRPTFGLYIPPESEADITFGENSVVMIAELKKSSVTARK